MPLLFIGFLVLGALGSTGYYVAYRKIEDKHPKVTNLKSINLTRKCWKFNPKHNCYEEKVP